MSSKKTKVLGATKSRSVNWIQMALIGGPILALLFALAWVIWIAPVLVQVICPSDEVCQRLGQVGDVFGGVNALFAGVAFAGMLASMEFTRRTFKQERQRSHEKEIFERICKAYRWAFEALMVEEGPRQDVSHKIQRWAIAAEHLLTAENLAKELKTNAFQLQYAQETLYWQSRLYELFDDSKFDQSYAYDVSPQEDGFDGGKAALVLASFIAQGNLSLLQKVDPEKLLGRPGLRSTKLGNGVATAYEQYRADTSASSGAGNAEHHNPLGK